MGGELAKWIIALRSESSSHERDAFLAWAREVARDDVTVEAEIEWLDAAAQSAHSPKPLRFTAYASLWLRDDGELVSLLGPPAGTRAFQVHERLAFDRSGRARELGRWAGAKKTTVWRAVEGVDRATWTARYRNHGAVASVNHATCMRYRQNVIVGGADDFDAVSELWWCHSEDLLKRFYASDEAKALVSVDAAGFVDAEHASPTVTHHEVLRLRTPSS